MEEDDEPYDQELDVRSSLITLGMFQFLVGPEQTPFDVYTSVFTDLSPEFEAIISNAGLARTYILEDVDEDVFNDLSDYAYSGNYTLPRYEKDTRPTIEHYPSLNQHGFRAVCIHGRNSRNTSFDHLDHAIVGRCQPHTRCLFCGQRFCQKPPHEDFADFRHMLCIRKEEISDHMSEAERDALQASLSGIHDDDDCSEALLHEAKLYKLANDFKVENLQFIASTRIHQILCLLPMTWRRIPDLIPFIRFVYCNTAPDDVLRSMVAGLTAIFTDHLMRHPEFRVLLEQHAVLCCDILQNTASRSAAVEEKYHHH
ncbi:hypothetical protein PG996_003412 [Apiospora saccharicola]|uniref:BTB domain-containing protein n=1 Tax=Apiospora saccharicola TaxID=335842 RepID=A0ABR1W2D1_9PEZI